MYWMLNIFLKCSMGRSNTVIIFLFNGLISGVVDLRF